MQKCNVKVIYSGYDHDYADMPYGDRRCVKQETEKWGWLLEAANISAAVCLFLEFADLPAAVCFMLGLGITPNLSAAVCFLQDSVTAFVIHAGLCNTGNIYWPSKEVDIPSC